MNLTKDQKRQLDFCLEHKVSDISVDLSVLIRFLSEVGIDDLEKIINNNEKFGKVVVKIKDYLLKMSDDKRNELYKLLTPIDFGENIKAYFVYGTNKSMARAHYAVEVYKMKLAPVVVSDMDVDNEYVDILKKGGVKNSDIFREGMGANFIENAYNSIKIVRENNLDLDQIGVISASLVALRAKLMTQIFLPKNSRIYSLPVEIDKSNPIEDPTSPENWYKNNKGVSVFLSEIIKLYTLKEFGILK